MVVAHQRLPGALALQQQRRRGLPLNLLLVLVLLCAGTGGGGRRPRLFSSLVPPEQNPLWQRRVTQPHSSSITKNHTMFWLDYAPDQMCGWGMSGLDNWMQLQETVTRQGEIMFAGNFDNASWAGYNHGDDWLSCIENISATFKRRGWLAINHGSTELRGTDFSPGNRSWNMEPISRFIEAMGDSYLGSCIGEKDGAFIWYVNQELFPNPPAGSSRIANYLQFYSYLEQFNANAGPTTEGAARLNFMAGSFTGPAVAARTGLFNFLTNEGGQFLPNDQLFYSIIRGAAKQYAAAIWSDVSTWGVSGMKCYYCGSDSSKHFQPAPPPPPGANDSFCCSEPGGTGPDCGLSLMAMKRLPYQAMMYNAWFVGSDGNPYYPGCLGGICANGSIGSLNPGGAVQRDQHDFALRVGGNPTRNPGLGVMLTPVALFVDVFQGFTPPRQNGYTTDLFRVCGGNRRYEAGDFWTHAVFDAMYQGYTDCGSLHSEQGYTAPTPYGDAADVINSDVAPWVLRRYQLVIVSSSLEFGPLEVRTKLAAHLAAGGDVFITGANLEKLPGGLLGVSADGCDGLVPAGDVFVEGDALAEERPWQACQLSVPSNAEHVATAAGQTVAVKSEAPGGGTLVVVAAAHGVPAEAVDPPNGGDSWGNPYRRDGSLATPFPMLLHVQRLLSQLLNQTVLFEAGAGLSTITNRRSDGSFVLSVSNGGLNERRMTVRSRIGSIESLTELEIGRGESDCQGYLPCGYPASTPLPKPGKNGNTTIRGGDIRFFVIRVDDDDAVEQIADEAPPPLPHGRGLPLRSAVSIRTTLLRRPSFLQHFDTVVVDHIYLGCSSVGTSNKGLWDCTASPATLRSDAFWLSREGPGPNGLGVVADLTALVAPYSMCQIDEDPGSIEPDAPPEDRFNTSKRVLESALQRAAMAGARDVVMGLHMLTTQDSEPNDPQTTAKQLAQFVTSIQWLADRAVAMNITVHMRHMCHLGGFPLPANGLGQMLAFVNKCKRPNLRVAVSLAAFACGPANETSAAQVLKVLRSAASSSLVGALLLANSQKDFLGNTVTVNGRLSDLAVNGTQWSTLQALVVAVRKGVGRPLPVWLDSWMETHDDEYAEAMAMVNIAR
jgi:hypothetical protein